MRDQPWPLWLLRVRETHFDPNGQYPTLAAFTSIRASASHQAVIVRYRALTCHVKSGGYKTARRIPIVVLDCPTISRFNHSPSPLYPSRRLRGVVWLVIGAVLRYEALNAAVLEAAVNGLVAFIRGVSCLLCEIKFSRLCGGHFFAPNGGITCHIQHVQHIALWAQPCTPFFGVYFFLTYTFFGFRK